MGLVSRRGALGVEGAGVGVEVGVGRGAGLEQQGPINFISFLLTELDLRREHFK